MIVAPVNRRREMKTKESWEAVVNNYEKSQRVRAEHIPIYGFPIVTVQVFKILVPLLLGKKVIDVCSGAAYLAAKLKSVGVDCTAMDNFSTKYAMMDGAHCFERFAHCDVVKADAATQDLSRYDVVIMSWPDYDEPFAATIAGNMRVNQQLLYQGEGWGGCTGDETFHKTLSEKFMEDEELSDRLDAAHIRFDGIYDNWRFYTKWKR